MSTLPVTKNTPLITSSPQSYSKMENDNFSWLTAMGFAFLTFNSGMAIYRSKGDTSSVTFVVVSYLDLLSLFYCLRLYEKSPHNSSQRRIIKAIVWSLTTLLTVMFSYKVAALMPLPVAVVVWAMASATILGGFYAFFLHQEIPPEPTKQ
ncbi:hypothetical protein LUZ63_015334 [Rhynchospora breviuscula]|uniref:Uncharacterized protein n=1 Tax=Rhynchospora breviuscula TaxID=2022672 RepID=A0A9Q0CC39_9POAL|nr:hypothetical protein LUZ63_015334 [Rhynchospora breviuscula]